MKQRILVVDDEISICTALAFALEDKFVVVAAQSPGQALALLQQDRFDYCLLDLRIGKYNGLDILPELKKVDPQMMVIVMTAYASIESSVDAIRSGAYTYLRKPLDISELYLVLSQAAEYQKLNAKVEYLSNQLAEKNYYHGMIGKSVSMGRVYSMVEKLMNIDSSVLITGESGTGKELVAKALHFAGSRKKEHFAAVNCAAIPEGLLESELFGHKKGSFTGAVTDQTGKLAYANDGTLFLDEIGDMPLSLQSKILRVLQSKEYSPIGSNEKHKLNIRVISATNKNLMNMVTMGTFRQDLYFRINVVEVEVPPLRERREDIKPLIAHFIAQNNTSFGKQISGMSNEAERKLYSYKYPGNVRELINIIEYAMVMCDGNTIEISHLPKSVMCSDCVTEPAGAGLFLENLIGLPLEEVERRVITANLERSHNHRIATAKVLGISEKGLRNKLAKYKKHDKPKAGS